ncbi:MAG: phosphoglycerate mutase family protein [Defluviitaleaceae bacterium]|nr:phosphoglycerate mutase family protein [Defluviitaleaceae bacterium]
MLLYIIRHGDPDYANDCLTERGKKQAAALAERFAAHGVRFDEIYSSPLGRAIQTAEPTCEKQGISYNIEEWMSENLCFADLSITNEKGERDWAFAGPNARMLDISGTWHESPHFPPTAAAGYKRIADASDEFLARLGYVRDGLHYKVAAPSDKLIAAFCHHGLGTTWLSHMLSIPPNIFWASFDIAHTGITIVRFNNTPRTAPQCLCLSDTAHVKKVCS